MKRNTSSTAPVLALTVPGQPIGKERARVVTHRGYAWAYTPGQTADWERRASAMMREAWQGQVPLDEPVALEVQAVGHRPQRLRRVRDPDGRVARAAKPDGDNVLKAVADALVKAGVVRDDARISDWRCVNHYAGKMEQPCVEVVLRRLDGIGSQRGMGACNGHVEAAGRAECDCHERPATRLSSVAAGAGRGDGAAVAEHGGCALESP